MFPNYHTHPTITQSILGIAEYVRANDFHVGIRETQEALSVASLGSIADKNLLRYSLKSIFCDSFESAEQKRQPQLWTWTNISSTQFVISPSKKAPPSTSSNTKTLITIFVAMVAKFHSRETQLNMSWRVDS